MTETWLTHIVPTKALFIPDFTVFRCDRDARSGNTRHGGILIGVRESENLKAGLLLVNNFSVDCLVIELQIVSDAGYKHAIILCCLYNPPKDCPCRWHESSFCNLLQHLVSLQSTKDAAGVILVGDINLKFVNWLSYHSHDLYDNTILDRLIELNFQQFVITSNGKSLDVVLCNNPVLINDVGFDFATTGKYEIDGKLLPDQIAVYSNLNLQVATYKRPVPPRRNLDFSIFSLSKVDWNCLNSAIMLEPFQPFCFSNVEVLIETWYKWLYDIFERNVPRKTKHRRNLPPWASPSSSHLIKCCKTMRRNLRKRRSLASTIKLKKL